MSSGLITAKPDEAVLVWLDDRRPPPGENWLWVKMPEDTIELLQSRSVTVLSLDHDLGLLDREPEATGYDVLLWIEAQVSTQGFVPPEVITVHSSNAAALPRMRRAIEAIQRLAGEAEQ